MKNIITTVCLSFFTSIGFSQKTQLKDYIVLNNNDTIFGENSMAYWEINPKEIYFKSRGTTTTYSIKNVKAFSVQDQSIYIKSTVTYQLNSIDINDARENYSKLYNTETVWLKLLYSGFYSLLELNTKERVYYFIKDTSEKIEELVYRVKLNETVGLVKDEQYKNRLLALSEQTQSNFKVLVENSRYDAGDLKKIFASLNNNKGVVSSKDNFALQSEIGAGVGVYSYNPGGNSYSINNYATIFPNIANYKSTISYKFFAGISLKSKTNINHFQPRLGIEFQTLNLDGSNYNTPVGLKEEHYSAKIYFIKPEVDLNYYLSFKKNAGMFFGPFFQTALLLNRKPSKLTTVYSNGTVNSFDDIPQFRLANFSFGINAGYTQNKSKIQLQWNEIANISNTSSPILSVSGFSILYAIVFIK